ncbi:MAG: translational GTPase TypA, partial [Clostridia bacterium]
CDYHGLREPKKSKITAIYQFEGLNRVPVESASAGNIVCFSGMSEITIGDTVCDPKNPTPLPFVKISEPTMEMTFSVNDSPFAGREGKFVTTRNIRDRLERELLKDVSLRVNEVEGATDSFNVAGRGEMHLSILIETMRREGYEFQVSTPRVLFKEIDGKLHEPVEELTIDVPEESVGAVMEKMGQRKAELTQMTPFGSRMRLDFLIPSRGLFGYRNEFLTDTKGEGILNTIFHGYTPFKGEIPRRMNGSLIAFETGEAVGYGIFNAQDRGVMFIDPGCQVYAGMVVGVSSKSEDLTVNVCKRKQLTNMRASGSDDSLRLVTPRRMSLEQTLEFLADDELMEVTPHNIR